MKKISNKLKLISLLGLILVTSVSSTIPAFAISTTTNDGRSTKSVVPSTTNKSVACTRLMTLQNTNKTNVATHVASMQSNFTTRLSTLDAHKMTIDQKVADARAVAKAKFEARASQIEAKEGLTPIQLEAIATYKSSMQQAEALRQSAIDVARSTYRATLATNVRSHQDKLLTSAVAYQTAVSDAFAVAVANCEDSGAIVTLKASIEDARQTLETARKTEQASSDVKMAATTRNEAIRVANEEFVKSAKTYTATLTTALKPATTVTNPATN